jgi:membrane-associated phospholipid phosphatase
MIRRLVLASALLATQIAWAQIPYRLSKRTDGLTYGANAALVGWNAYAATQHRGLSEFELATLGSPQAVGWDRVALNRWDESAGKRSDYALFAAFGTAGLTALAHTHADRRFGDAVVLGSMWFQTNLSTLMLSDAVKNSVRRNRPFVYYDGAPLAERMEADARKSFFSGHASLTACNTFFAAKVWSDMHPDSRWAPVVWSAAALVPAYVACQRVEAGKHYPSDVVIGTVVGAAVGYLIPTIHLDR